MLPIIYFGKDALSSITNLQENKEYNFCNLKSMVFIHSLLMKKLIKLLGITEYAHPVEQSTKLGSPGEDFLNLLFGR